jgi:hypothetical protein
MPGLRRLFVPRALRAHLGAIPNSRNATVGRMVRSFTLPTSHFKLRTSHFSRKAKRVFHAAGPLGLLERDHRGPTPIDCHQWHPPNFSGGIHDRRRSRVVLLAPTSLFELPTSNFSAPHPAEQPGDGFRPSPIWLTTGPRFDLIRHDSNLTARHDSNLTARCGGYMTRRLRLTDR